MSVIAWDGRSIAADKQDARGNVRLVGTKLWRLPSGIVLGTTGSLQVGLELKAWFESGADPAKYPESQKDTGKWARLVCADSKTSWCYEQTPFPIYSEQPFMAWGSGDSFALAAMEAGTTAERAVEITIELCTECGIGVDVFDLRQGGAAQNVDIACNIVHGCELGAQCLLAGKCMYPPVPNRGGTKDGRQHPHCDPHDIEGYSDSSEKVKAWHAVWETLKRVVPDFPGNQAAGIECATIAIEVLAMRAEAAERSELGMSEYRNFNRKTLADRFLSWPLPESVCADLCATKQQVGRTGTNLLNAFEAFEMVDYLLAPPHSYQRSQAGQETLDIGPFAVGELRQMADAGIAADWAKRIAEAPGPLVSVCCREYATCTRPCSPKDQWRAEQFKAWVSAAMKFAGPATNLPEQQKQSDGGEK